MHTYIHTYTHSYIHTYIATHINVLYSPEHQKNELDHVRNVTNFSASLQELNKTSQATKEATTRCSIRGGRCTK